MSQNASPRSTRRGNALHIFIGATHANTTASYLEVSVQRGPDSPASRDIQGDLVEPLGLHLVDMEVAIGNLIDLVGQQTKRYLASTGRR